MTAAAGLTAAEILAEDAGAHAQALDAYRAWAAGGAEAVSAMAGELGRIAEALDRVLADGVYLWSAAEERRLDVAGTARVLGTTAPQPAPIPLAEVTAGLDAKTAARIHYLARSGT